MVVAGCPARSVAPAAVLAPDTQSEVAPAPEAVQPASEAEEAKEQGEQGEPNEHAGLEHGQASWYGGKHHGRKTASGERFNKNKLTAAHRTLRFGTMVRVTSLKSGKSVVVRINDRGPFGNKRRIIDVSEAAARKLDMIRAGVVPVTIEVLDQAKPGEDTAAKPVAEKP